MLFLDASIQNESSDRIAFITDIATVVGSVFGGKPKKGQPSPMDAHMDALKEVINGAKDYGSGK